MRRSLRYSVTATEQSWRRGRDAALMGEFFVGIATIPYGLFERIENGLPPTPDTDAMVVLAASRQTNDGSWQFPNEIRPPINGSTFRSDRPSHTYLAHVRAAGASTGHGTASRTRTSVPRCVEPDETQDRAFKLLGLVWSGASAHKIEKAKAALIALQRRNGGWGQIPTLDPDAYTTGKALYALHAAGMAPTAATYRRGADYMLRTQLEMERRSSGPARSLFSRTWRRGFPTDAASSFRRPPRAGLRSPSRTRSTECAVDEGRSGWMRALRAGRRDRDAGNRREESVRDDERRRQCRRLAPEVVD